MKIELTKTAKKDLLGDKKYYSKKRNKYYLHFDEIQFEGNEQLIKLSFCNKNKKVAEFKYEISLKANDIYHIQLLDGQMKIKIK